MERRLGQGPLGIGVGLIAAAAAALGAPPPFWIGALLIGFALVLHAVVVGEFVPQPKRDKSLPPPNRDFLPIHPRRLIAPFRENTQETATRMSQQYVGSWLRLTGRVARGDSVFERERGGFRPLTLSPNELPVVFFKLASGGYSLEPGERVTLIGRIIEIREFGVYLDDCEVE